MCDWAVYIVDVLLIHIWTKLNIRLKALAFFLFLFDVVVATAAFLFSMLGLYFISSVCGVNMFSNSNALEKQYLLVLFSILSLIALYIYPHFRKETQLI